MPTRDYYWRHVLRLREQNRIYYEINRDLIASKRKKIRDIKKKVKKPVEVKK